MWVFTPMLQSCALEALGVPELPPRGARATPTPCGDAPGMDAAGGQLDMGFTSLDERRKFEAASIGMIPAPKPPTLDFIQDDLSTKRCFWAMR